MADSAYDYFGAAPVMGSVAYDFQEAPAFVEETFARPIDAAGTVTAPRTAPGERARAKTAARTRQGVSPVTLLGFAIAAVLLIFTLLAQIQLTTISDGAVGLEETLSQLEDEQDKLLIKYEEAFNLSEIEEYAISELGMQKPRSDQVFYVQSSATDRAEVITPAEDTGALDLRLGDLFGSLGEYFG